MRCAVGQGGLEIDFCWAQPSRRAERGIHSRSAMASFDIRSPSDFLQKLRDEQADFIKSHCLDARHALNAVMTAYHLHEWVWGGFAKRDYTLHRSWSLRRAHVDEFKRYLFGKCPALEEAEALTNSTKHFRTDRNVVPLPTGKHEGAFQRDAFQDDAFDVSYLWVERGGKRQRVEEFIQELVEFWESFFKEHNIG